MGGGCNGNGVKGEGVGSEGGWKGRRVEGVGWEGGGMEKRWGGGRHAGCTVEPSAISLLLSPELKLNSPALSAIEIKCAYL